MEQRLYLWQHKWSYRSTAQLLIAAGADVNKARTTDGATPLLIAAEDGRTETAQLLIKAGAEVNKAKQYGATPLWIAAQDGHTATAQLLIKAGADVNKPDNNGRTPLYIAAAQWSYSNSTIIR